MPTWSDDEGRYWCTTKAGETVEIPHAPVGLYEHCQCICCLEGLEDKHPAYCPVNKGPHTCDGKSVVGADGATGIVDVNCSACGRSGSFALDDVRVNW